MPRSELAPQRTKVLARAEADDARFVRSDDLKAWVAQGLHELS
jgi:hypothetical protein